MSLSDEERQRIHEEESERRKARQQLGAEARANTSLGCIGWIVALCIMGWAFGVSPWLGYPISALFLVLYIWGQVNAASKRR